MTFTNKFTDLIVTLFNNNLFKLVFLSLLLAYSFDKYPYINFLILFAFIAINMYLNQIETNDNILQLDSIQKYKNT